MGSVYLIGIQNQCSMGIHFFKKSSIWYKLYF